MTRVKVRGPPCPGVIGNLVDPLIILELIGVNSHFTHCAMSQDAGFASQIGPILHWRKQRDLPHRKRALRFTTIVPMFCDKPFNPLE